MPVVFVTSWLTVGINHCQELPNTISASAFKEVVASSAVSDHLQSYRIDDRKWIVCSQSDTSYKVHVSEGNVTEKQSLQYSILCACT